MWRRIVGTVLFAFVLAPASGCVELTQTFTINPDGRGKVQLDILMAVDFDFSIAADPNAKEKTLDEQKRDAAIKFLTKGRAVTAWKDVSVQWAPDGRLHYVATAYFDRLDDLDVGDSKPSGTGFSFRATTEKDGSLKINGKKDAKEDPNKKPAADPAKMTDKELDDHVLKQRVDFQRAKPLLVVFLTDLKINTVFRLPGKAVEVKGFKKDTDLVVSFNIDGNKALAGIKKFMAQDNATLKKLMKESKNGELLKELGWAELAAEPSLTVPNGQAQFDYDREVKEARAAYPALRKKLGLDENTKLPGESP